MTNTTVPTDADLLELANVCERRGVLRNGLVHEVELLDFARAVLAKWGTPQPSPVGPPAPRVEPVAWLNPWRADQVTTDYDAYGRRGIPLYTAPQPVEREPLSIEEVEAILARWDYAIHGDRARYIVRETERAHGITAKEPTP